MQIGYKRVRPDKISAMKSRGGWVAMGNAVQVWKAKQVFVVKRKMGSTGYAGADNPVGLSPSRF